MYLKKFGFDVTNDIFAKNAWYFRNALVRANYTNIEKNIYDTTKYLEDFLNNLLFGSNIELKNRHLHINWGKKVDIDIEKVDIHNKKVNIESLKLTSTMRKNIISLFKVLSNLDYFGRSEVVKVLNMSSSGASKLISKLLDFQIIRPVFGYGKGKYCFNIVGVKYE